MTKTKRTSPAYIWLFLKTAVLATFEATFFALMPYRVTARRFGLCVNLVEAREFMLIHRLTPDQERIAQDVRWAIDAVVRRAPFTIWCVPQSLTARALLRARVPWVVYIGFEPDKPVEDIPAKHAWMNCGSVCVSGFQEANSFTPIAAYLSGAPKESGLDDPSPLT